MKPNFAAHWEPIAVLANSLFNEITNLSKEIRPDDKERTGVQIMIREIGTRNLMFQSIQKPSEAAQFFSVEKAVRSATLGHAASQNSEDPDKMQFAGSVTITLPDGTQYQASISGLKAPEDVGIAIVLLSYAVQWSVAAVIQNIKDHNGMLPDFLSDQKHYMRKVMEY